MIVLEGSSLSCLTSITPATEARYPAHGSSKGKMTALKPYLPTKAAPSIMPVTMSPLKLWKRSDPLPAQSPTLSPTRSAITAGFLGSSSGIPCSTFPTRSAPMSAALVKIPPPTCAKSAIRLAPKPNPTRSFGFLRRMKRRVTPTRLRAGTERPMRLPPIKAMRNAVMEDFLAASVTRPWTLTTSLITE